MKLQAGEYVSLGKVETVLKMTPTVDNICVYADSLKMYTVALVVPNQKQVRILAEKIGIDTNDWQRACENKDIIKEVMKSIQEQGKKGEMQGTHQASAHTQTHMHTHMMRTRTNTYTQPLSSIHTYTHTYTTHTHTGRVYRNRVRKVRQGTHTHVHAHTHTHIYTRTEEERTGTGQKR